MMNEIAGVIPARWASSRFPGKPLALLGGVPMVLHVWRKCLEAGLARVIVATDDERIVAVCRAAGAEVVLTDPALPSGTDRCAAIAADLALPFIINIQGDEPFIDPLAIRQVGTLLMAPDAASIATLARVEKDPRSLRSPHVVKVVRNRRGDALYFSRQWIPYRRDVPENEWPSMGDDLVHLGIYGFARSTLLELAALPPSSLEQAEQLEQLRWLEQGYRIAVGLTSYRSIGIDTPEDLEAASEQLARKTEGQQ